MHMAADLRKVRYLINVLGLTLEEFLHMDVLAPKYSLVPQLSAVRPALLNGKRIELARRSVEGGVS